MHYRLRAAVRYVFNEQRVIFRLREAYLPMSSPSLSFWLPSLLGRLREPARMRDLYGMVGSVHHTAVDRLVFALDGAGMLFKSSSESDLRYSAEEQRLAEAISRLEESSLNPVSSFRQTRNAQTLIVGRADQADYIARLASRSGFLNLSIVTQESDLCWAVTDFQRGEASAAGHRMRAANLDDVLASVPIADNVVIVCDSFKNDELRKLVKDYGRLGAVRVFLIMVHDGGVSLATLWRAGVFPCNTCVWDHLVDAKATVRTRNNDPIPDDFQIAAALAVQRLWDVATGFSDEEEDFIIYRVGLKIEIARHIVRPACMKCTHGGYISPKIWSCEASIGEAEMTASFTPESFLLRSGRLLIDSETGTIERIGEYDLLQFPQHQSTAKLGSPIHDRAPATWTIESGDEVYDARITAIRSGVESWLLQRIGQTQRRYKQRDSESGARLSAARQQTSQYANVASGLSYVSAVADGFGRAFAAFANARLHWACWRRYWENDTGSSDLIRRYLEDIRAWNDVVIETMSDYEVSEIYVLRFSYKQTVISVVMGMKEQDVYTRGLEDVGSWIAWQNSSLAAEGQLQIPKFRSDKELRSATSAQLELLQSRLGVRIGHSRLGGVITHFAEPFCFALVILEPRPSNEKVALD